MPVHPSDVGTVLVQQESFGKNSRRGLPSSEGGRTLRVARSGRGTSRSDLMEEDIDG